MRSRDDVLAVVKASLMDILEDVDESQFDPSKSMKDLGANSLDIVEVVSCSMRKLKVKVPRSELAGLQNIDQLVDLMHRVMQEKAAAAAAE